MGLYKFRKELIQELLKENEVYISLPDGTLVDLLKKMGCKFINTDVDRRGLNPFKDLKLINEYRKVFKR
ncbi:glycosyltransferase [Coprobacillaceae bacterium CR2/5/TPMF4]|nr:glycosyltransferase [Coprobacillaceae bacterium CR2/5/TPMF4]